MSSARGLWGPVFPETRQEEGEAGSLLPSPGCTCLHRVIVQDTSFKEPCPVKPPLQSCSSDHWLGDSHFCSMDITTLTSWGCGEAPAKTMGVGGRRCFKTKMVCEPLAEGEWALWTKESEFKSQLYPISAVQFLANNQTSLSFSSCLSKVAMIISTSQGQGGN